ncbi:MAG: hypothetical protein WAN11_04710 [Syntrophobacteraceae bacterium]
MRNIVFALALLICFAVQSIAADLNVVSGVYLNKSDDTQFLTLRPDATFFIKQRKKPPDKENPFVEFSGKYELNEEQVTLILDDGRIGKGQLKGNVFTDGQGQMWVKKSEEEHNVVRPKYKPWYR